jgi:hypothetical protein
MRTSQPQQSVPTSPGRRLTVLSCFVVLFVCSLNTHSEERTVSREDQFKAAYLVNFVSLVEWPATTLADRLTICFVGAQGVLSAVSAGIDTKLIGTRHLEVKPLAKSASLSGCNAVYVEADEAKAFLDITAIGTQPILTVSDTREFAKRGGMIGLFTADNRLRFNINVGVAQKAGLRISSKLLQLAVTVEKGEHP